VFTGCGRNGKGGLTQTLAKVMGAFYKAMNPGLICDRKVSNLDAERGKLLGARLAVFDELQDGERLNTDAVQLLSGGDGIPARQLYGDPITVQPRHLCILATNHLPKMDQVINAIMERILVIEFPVFFTDLAEGEAPTALRRQKDAGLKKRLEGNLEGVLKWLVAGAVRWYANPGLKKKAPEKVRAFSRQYFEEQDQLMAFIKECCVVEAGAEVSTTEFHAAYCAWLGGPNGNGARPPGPKTLVGLMRNKGFAKDKIRVGKPLNGYLGLRLQNVFKVVQEWLE
jgi:putative DNA primase/helicase